MESKKIFVESIVDALETVLSGLSVLLQEITVNAEEKNYKEERINE